jgi:hypothetical protein
MKKIIVIGNGSSALINKNGKLIDTFDVVVRMGTCVIYGYEEYIGTKTDILRTSWDRLFVEKSNNLHFTSSVDCKQYLFLEPLYEPYIESTSCGCQGTLYKIFNKPRFQEFKFKSYITKYNERILHELFIKNFFHNKDILYYNMNRRIKLFMLYNNLFIDNVLHMPSSGLCTLDFVVNTFCDYEIFITGFDGFKTRYYWRHRDEYFDSHSSIKEQLYLKQLIKNKMVRVL